MGNGKRPSVVEGLVVTLLRRKAKPVHLHVLRPDGTLVWIGNWKEKRPMPGDRWRQLRLIEEEGKLLYATDPSGPPPYPPVGKCGGLPVALGRLRPLPRDEWRR